MYKNLHAKTFYILPVAILVGMVLLGGCVADKQMVPPYQGRIQREVAKQQQQDRYPPTGEQVKEFQYPEPLTSKQGVDDEDLLVPLLSHVNERIFAYEQRLTDLNSLQEKLSAQQVGEQQLVKIDECREQVQQLLQRYNELNQRLLEKNSVTTRQLLEGETLLDLEKLDFQFLESECNRAPAEIRVAGPTQPTEGDPLQQQRQELISTYTAGAYERTIEDYERLLNLTTEPLPYDVTFAYGQALMKTGRESDARRVFKELLARIRQQDQAQWEFRLMQLIGDLDFALGSFSDAKEQYDEIVKTYQDLGERNNWANQQLSALKVANEQSEEVRAYADLLRSYLAYNPNRDGFNVFRKAEAFVETYPYSLVASSADHLVTVSQEEAEKWYRNLLQQVDTLAAEGRYQDAILAMEGVPRSILPADKQQELAARSEELSTTEAVARETKQLEEEQKLQATWNAGMNFLQIKEYDQAIDAFNALLGSSYDEQAKMRIDEATRLAVQENRKRAAELFVRANRTDDPESRKRLLLASRQLLQDILIKYPKVDLIDKVRRNLEKIEQEINAIDPALLSAPVTINGEISRPVGSSSDMGFDEELSNGEIKP